MQGCEPAGRPTTPGVRRAAPAWSRSPPPRRRSGATDDAPRARRSRYPVPSSTMRLKQRLTSEARAARAESADSDIEAGSDRSAGACQGSAGPAGRGADEARRPRCVSLPRRTRQRGRWGGDAHEEGLFPDLEGTRKRLRTPFPGSRTGSNDHLPLWLITFREPPERPAVRGPAPFEPGRSAGGGEARASLDERARSRRQGRPALRSRGRAHAHAAGLTMPLETTTSCGRPESRICQFLALGNTRRRVPGRAVSRVPSSAVSGLLFALPQPIGTHALGDNLSFLGRLLAAPALGRGAAGRRLCRHRGRGRTGRPPPPRRRKQQQRVHAAG